MSVLIKAPLTYFEPKTRRLPVFEHRCYFRPAIMDGIFLGLCVCGETISAAEVEKRINDPLHSL